MKTHLERTIYVLWMWILHVLVGAVGFTFVALVAFGIEVFVDALEAAKNTSTFWSTMVRGGEYAVLVLDVVTCVIYLIIMSRRFVRELTGDE